MTSRGRLAFLGTVAAAGVLALPAAAAVPRLLMFDGRPLTRPVVISAWREIARFQQAILTSPNAASRHLRGRPSLRLSLFWGTKWNDYVEQHRPLWKLRPRDADTFGRFYPAWRGRPAVVDLSFAEHGPKRASPIALAILRRYRIPVRI